jgi:hypothetical protein
VTAGAELAALRLLTFEATSVVIELSHSSDGVVGQIVPPDSGSAWLHTANSTSAPAEIDDCGCFTFPGRPDEAFRLICRTRTGLRVLTEWIRP